MTSTENASVKETVAQQLHDLGVKGVLVQMAARGQIVELLCEMPTCYCPKRTEALRSEAANHSASRLGAECGSLPHTEDGRGTPRLVERAARACEVQS
jgi:hypothetical protein